MGSIITSQTELSVSILQLNKFSRMSTFEPLILKQIKKKVPIY